MQADWLSSADTVQPVWLLWLMHYGEWSFLPAQLGNTHTKVCFFFFLTKQQCASCRLAL